MYNARAHYACSCVSVGQGVILLLLSYSHIAGLMIEKKGPFLSRSCVFELVFIACVFSPQQWISVNKSEHTRRLIRMDLFKLQTQNTMKF